jgi:NNP family nitrate/nitrite transporter-like MFS transporter
MNDLIGVWTSCFMLLFVLVATALSWMHFAIRRMDVARHPQLVRDTDLPEIMSQTVQHGVSPATAAKG